MACDIRFSPSKIVLFVLWFFKNLFYRVFTFCHCFILLSHPHGSSFQVSQEACCSFDSLQISILFEMQHPKMWMLFQVKPKQHWECRCSHQGLFTAIILLIQPNTGTAIFMIADLSQIYVYFDLYTLLDEPYLTVFLTLITLPCVNLFPFVFTEPPHLFQTLAPV